ncbi:arylesterase [Aridibaculum aurantiacum]|uniref:arylesterase n=1 Tax=Aridibaculum aurantiacum TaxID=2810307 RepID=UPI001A975A97|nr:arylesterase [Aridibaculum aurantiacum]
MIRPLILLISLAMVVGACKNENNKTADADTAKTGKAASDQLTRNILFFGNSLTAGYGLDPSEAFPSLIQQKIDSADLPYKVVNAGVSGETSAGGKGRIDWILKQPVDVFILELGANDGLRGVPVNETRANLQTIIDRVRKKYPQVKIVLAGMQIPPNMGESYANQFRNMYVELAEKNNVVLVPFLLEGVGGVRELNLPDGIHPTAEGHKIVANNVWAVLEDVLRQ